MSANKNHTALSITSGSNPAQRAPVTLAMSPMAHERRNNGDIPPTSLTRNISMSCGKINTSQQANAIDPAMLESLLLIGEAAYSSVDIAVCKISSIMLMISWACCFISCLRVCSMVPFSIAYSLKYGSRLYTVPICLECNYDKPKDIAVRFLSRANATKTLLACTSLPCQFYKSQMALLLLKLKAHVERKRQNECYECSLCSLNTKSTETNHGPSFLHKLISG